MKLPLLLGFAVAGAVFVACVGEAKKLGAENDVCSVTADCFAGLVCDEGHHCAVATDATVKDAGPVDAETSTDARTGTPIDSGTWCKGSEYPCVFVTSGASSAPDSAAAADTACQTYAGGDAGALGGTWRAWYSDSTAEGAAGRRVGIRNGSVFQPINLALQSIRITISAAQITLSDPINTNESGQQVKADAGAVAVWTATKANGEYGQGVNGCKALVGNLTATDTKWTEGGTCPFQGRLYCFQVSK